MKIAGRLDLAELGLAETGRFAVLWHQFPSDSDPRRESHFDLLLEMGEHLLTFQTQSLPKPSEAGGRSTSIPARRIADHRPLYLDYEGEISGNRGFVRRIANGIYTLLVPSAANPTGSTRVELTAGKALETDEDTEGPHLSPTMPRSQKTGISVENSTVLILPKCNPNENCEILVEGWSIPVKTC
jgi:hypothetical protein